MDESSYEEKFADLAKGLETEKIIETLGEQSRFVVILAQHCGAIYRTARRAGLPRGVAERMALDYFSYQIHPAEMYVVGGEG